MHAAFFCICHGNGARKHKVIGTNFFDGTHHVGELANARGLNENAVGRVLGEHLFQRLAKIAHQTAANTARVHFVDNDTGIGKKSTVNTDLAKLVFDQHKALAHVSLTDQLFDQRGLAGAEKARENIDLGHSYTSLSVIKILRGCKRAQG